MSFLLVLLSDMSHLVIMLVTTFLIEVGTAYVHPPYMYVRWSRNVNSCTTWTLFRIAGYSTLQINPLKPCCVGVSKEYSCGSVDESGAKKYIVCDKPKLSFFWDTIHPSQNGWHEVYSAIKSSLRQLYLWFIVHV